MRRVQGKHDPKVICKHCTRILASSEIRRCSKCSTPYCSKTCQISHWHSGGHKEDCAILSNRKSNAAKAQKEEAGLDSNILAIQNEIFCQNQTRINYESLASNIDLVDVVVALDLRFAPPQLEVISSAGLLSKYSFAAP